MRYSYLFGVQVNRTNKNSVLYDCLSKKSAVQEQLGRNSESSVSK